MFEKLTNKAKEALFLETGLHLVGNRELMVENCGRIEECSEVFMSLACGRGLVIRGKISRIEIEERRKS